MPFHPGEASAQVSRRRPDTASPCSPTGRGLLNDVAGAQEFFAGQGRAARPVDVPGELCVDAPGQDDDRTAVVVWCGAGARAVGPR